ncbi:acylphosphatase [Methanophagales archaeon]|nr:MAG: acylphosphatase [Methanophagales archaeon]
MQTRTEIIVKGEVQRVGYRDEVEKIARKLNIKGFVENLKPYDVRIVCEDEEGDVKRFIRALRMDGDPLIRVSDIAVEYDRPTGEFEYFEIKKAVQKKSMLKDSILSIPF